MPPKGRRYKHLLARRFGLVNDQVAPLGTWNSTLNQQSVFFRKYLNHPQITHGDLRIAHMARRFHPLENPGGPRRSPNRARSTMEHGTVRPAATAEMMSLVDTSEAITFGYSRDINVVVLGENIRQNLVSNVDFASLRSQPNFAEKTHRVRAGLLEMPFPRPVHVFRRRQLNQPELGRLIPFFARGFPLHHDARPCLQDGHRSDVSVFPEDLRHAEFLAKDCFHHVRSLSVVRRPLPIIRFGEQRTTDNRRLYFVCSFPNALISISTPEGKSSFVKASMVFEGGFQYVY